MIVPGHVVLGLLEQPGFVFLKDGEVIEGIDPVELAGMDQAHEEIPDVGAMFGLEEVSCSCGARMAFLRACSQRLLSRGRSGHAEEQGQGLPVLEHVSHGLSHG